VFPKSVGDPRDRVDADGASRRQEEVYRRTRDAREVGQLVEADALLGGELADISCYDAWAPPLTGGLLDWSAM